MGQFQSPLHRGLGSDQVGCLRRHLWALVSIPSSSGPGFGPTAVVFAEGAMPSFNPLFIGAWVRTSLLQPRRSGRSLFQSPLHRGLGSDQPPLFLQKALCLVSIPSSSGPGFGHIRAGDVRRAMKCFNPLFIGAWVRTYAAQYGSQAVLLFQSPLHRGLGSDVKRRSGIVVLAVFQSPLHRGLGSDQTTGV